MASVDILVAIVALCLVIILHEGGHYLAAVISGMKVDRFSVFGIGPAIVRLGTWRGTEFVISAIPFGAYVLIRGMEAADEEPAPTRASNEEFNFRDKPLPLRAFVIAGGPIANYITAIALFFAVFVVFGPKLPPQAIFIDGFEDDSSAQRAGLELGDELLVVGDVEIDPSLRGRDVVDGASPYRGRELPVTVSRNGERVDALLQVPEEGLALGVQTRVRAPRERVGVGVALREAVTQPFVATAAQLEGLWMLVTRQISGSVQGPLGIVEQIAKSARRGAADFIEITAIISTLLGMFNLLPLPALDGGRLTFLAYEAVARRRTNPRIEELIHGYGMLALLMLLVWATVGDVRRLF